MKNHGLIRHKIIYHKLPLEYVDDRILSLSLSYFVKLLDQWEDLFLVGPGYNTTYGINSTHTTNFSQELNSTQNIKVKFQAAEVYQ